MCSLGKGREWKSYLLRCNLTHYGNIDVPHWHVHLTTNPKHNCKPFSRHYFLITYSSPRANSQGMGSKVWWISARACVTMDYNDSLVQNLSRAFMVITYWLSVTSYALGRNCHGPFVLNLDFWPADIPHHAWMHCSTFYKWRLLRFFTFGFSSQATALFPVLRHSELHCCGRVSVLLILS